MKFFKELFCNWLGHKLKYPVHFCERCGFDLSKDYTENGLQRYKNPPPPRKVKIDVFLNNSRNANL